MKNIRIKIVLAMLTAACIPLGILAGILLYQVKQQIQGDMHFAQDRADQDIKEKIEQFDEDFYETAYRIYSNTELLLSLKNDTQYEPDNSRTYDAAKDMNQFFMNIYNYRVQDIVGLYLINSHAHPVGYFIPELSRMGGKHGKYIQALTTDLQVPEGARSETRFVSDRIYGEPVIQYLFPIHFRGQYVGTLIIDAKASHFREMVERYNTFYKGKVVITDASYRVLYHTDASRTGTIVQPSAEPRASVVIETPLSVPDWKLIYIYAISPKLLVIRNLAFLMVALSFLLAIGFSLYLGYSITRPIIQLHRKMKLIEIGDYNARASIKSHDEIGFLGDQFNRMAGTIQQLIENDLRLQLINKETQIRALQAQISPHFLYNTLQTISSIAMVRQVPEIKTVSQSLGNMYRYNMKITNEGVSIQEEIMHVRNYLTIINKRFPEQIRIHVHTDPSVRELQVPKLILQPIVENAVEHSLIPSRRERKLIKITAKADVESGSLYLTVLDNGKGMTAHQAAELNAILQNAASRKDPGLRDGFSIGLSNVQMRIQLLCGREYGLRLYGKPEKGTCVTFRLPLDRQGGELG
ncbi:sensor histidine kinase [Cohnella sp. JJ-181]|uniref:sensor histidine kinase n=1 Tax=Cohnella rhizoplanae TaxID=2974897 RepID=UPI00232FD4B1|nr:histidine kinase [Cohnella sp. JJ-181]